MGSNLTDDLPMLAKELEQTVKLDVSFMQLNSLQKFFRREDLICHL